MKPPAPPSTLLALSLSILIFAHSFLGDYLLLLWHDHQFSWNALLEFRFAQLFSRIKPPSHLIYPYKAYYDELTSPPQIRVFLTSKCLFDNTEFAIVSGDSTHAAAVGYFPGGHCPSVFLAAYEWQHFELDTVGAVAAPNETITLTVNQTRSVQVPVMRRERTVTEGKIEACMPTLYWDDDWPRTILFLEHWRQHNVHFTIYVWNISTDVKKVFDYYQHLGLLTVIPWPDMPVMENIEDPNRGIFRMSYILPNHDCMFRSDAEFALLLDTDEALQMKNNLTLLEFLRAKKQEHPDMGALKIERFALKMGPLDHTFSALSTPTFLGRKEPATKPVFMPSRTRTVSFHEVGVQPFGYREYRVDPSEAIILHHRINYSFAKGGGRGEQYPFFSSQLQQQLLSKSREIFGYKLPSYTHGATEAASNACYKRLTDLYGGSVYPRVVPYMCKEELRDLADWVEYGASEDSRFGVV